MPDAPPGAPSKPVLARAALERVLARAADLQARTGTAGDEAPLTEAQLIEIANEVGLSRENVRQALAEERARIDLGPEGGWAFSMLGSSTIGASRTVPGDVPAVLTALDSWMQRAESLQVKRRFPDQLSWEPRQDFFTAVRRTLKMGGRPFTLAAASEVHAIVAMVEGKRSHVRIVARFDDARDARAKGALIATAAGLAVGVPAFAMAMQADLFIAAALSLLPALVLPMTTVAVVRGAYRKFVSRANVALEQALDRLEYGEAPKRGIL